MKTNFKILSTVIILSSILFWGCKEKEMCRITYSNIIKTDTLIDYNATSLHYREKVAVFKLTDNSVFYSDADRNSFCHEKEKSECKAFLAVQNLTNQKTRINYKIKLNGGTAHQGDITIPPNGTIDDGTIIYGCISSSQYIVESTNITYL